MVKHHHHMPAHFSRRARKSTYPHRRKNRIARRANRTKKYARRRKSATAQSRQIVSLAKSVATISKRLPSQNYHLAQGLYHRITDYTLGTATTNTSFQVIPLIPCLSGNGSGTIPAWRGWGPGYLDSFVPTEDADVGLPTFTPSARQGMIDLQMYFDIGSENDSSVNFTVAVVTLDKDVAARMTETQMYGYDLQGMTNLPNDEANKYYCAGGVGAGASYPSLGGMITFAPGKFKVLKKTQFNLAMSTPGFNTLQEGRTLVTNRGDTRKLIHWKIPCGYTINPQMNEPWANVKAGKEYVPPHNVRYLVISTDNQIVDAENPYMNLFASTIVYGKV